MDGTADSFVVHRADNAEAPPGRAPDFKEPRPVTSSPAQPSADLCATGVLSHFHEHNGGYIACFETCDCGKRSSLPALFAVPGAIVTLGLSVPPEGHPLAQRSEHPVIQIHLNLGDEVHHEGCLNFTGCGVCMGPVWEAMFANGGGTIGYHPDLDDDTTLKAAPFRVANFREARDAVAAVQERHIPYNLN